MTPKNSFTNIASRTGASAPGARCPKHAAAEYLAATHLLRHHHHHYSLNPTGVIGPSGNQVGAPNVGGIPNHHQHQSSLAQQSPHVHNHTFGSNAAAISAHHALVHGRHGAVGHTGFGPNQIPQSIKKLYCRMPTNDHASSLSLHSVGVTH